MSRIEYFGGPNGNRRAIWPWLLVALVLVAGAATILVLKSMRPSAERVAANWYTVRPDTLRMIIHQDGELQSLDNIDITCPVEGQNTIQQIVTEGTFVKKGDVIAVLDATEHGRRLEQANLELEKADADFKWSLEQKTIQEVKNAADLDVAMSELSLAKLDLREYTEGSYPASLREAQRKLEMAEISLKRKEQELASSKKLMDRGFTTLSEVQKSELEVVTARNEQEKAATDLRVLIDYKHEREQAEKQNKVSQAENKVARVKNENASNLAQKVSDLNTKERQLSMRKAAAERGKEMFENCTIKAPADGMVLYASSIERFVYREQPIQAGAKIMQGQMIVRLPDTTKMKAVVKVPESRVTRLRAKAGETIRADCTIVGTSTPVGASLTKVGVLPDNTQRWMNPDSKDYPVDLTLDHTPPGLKPGASVAVDIHVGQLDGVLTAPIGAIYSVGEDHYVFVRDNPHPKPRKVIIGESNETLVHIVDGLTSGQEVLLLQAGQGQQLLDQAGIKQTDATTRPAITSEQPSRVVPPVS